jgi:hypothetical protein
MKFTSRNSVIIISNNTVTLNGNAYSVTSSTADMTRINFGIYIVKIRDNILTLIDQTSNVIETFILEEMEQQPEDDTYIIKKDLHVSIDSHRKVITFMDSRFPITNRRTVGSTSVYVCEAGILGIPSKPNRNCTWNGVQISNLKK